MRKEGCLLAQLTVVPAILWCCVQAEQAHFSELLKAKTLEAERLTKSGQLAQVSRFPVPVGQLYKCWR